MAEKNEIKTLARKLKISVEELAFADLVSVGWEPKQAYLTALRRGAAWKKGQLEFAASDLLATPAVQTRVNDVRESMREKDGSVRMWQSTVEKEISKETTLKKLISTQRLYDPGSPEWLKIQQMIIDVTNMKKQETEDEQQSLVHFYLPQKVKSLNDTYVREEECGRERTSEQAAAQE